MKKFYSLLLAKHLLFIALSMLPIGSTWAMSAVDVMVAVASQTIAQPVIAIEEMAVSVAETSQLSLGADLCARAQGAAALMVQQRSSVPSLVDYDAAPARLLEKAKIHLHMKQSPQVHKLVNCINQKLCFFCGHFNRVEQLSEYEVLLRQLYDIYGDLEKLRDIEPAAYILVPEIERMLRHIELPLTELVIGKKQALNARDISEIAWSIENHFQKMHDYTLQERCQVPGGVLKDTIEAYRSTWLMRPFEWARNVGTRAFRDLCNVENVRQSYQDMLAQREQLAQIQVNAIDVPQLHDSAQQYCFEPKEIVASHSQSRLQECDFVSTPANVMSMSRNNDAERAALQGIATGIIEGIKNIDLAQLAHDTKEGVILLGKGILQMHVDAAVISNRLDMGDYQGVLDYCERRSADIEPYVEALNNTICIALENAQETIAHIDAGNTVEIEKLAHNTASFATKYIIESYITAKCLTGVKHLAHALPAQMKAANKILTQSGQLSKQNMQKLILAYKLESLTPLLGRDFSHMPPKIEWLQKAHNVTPSEILSFAHRHPELMAPLSSIAATAERVSISVASAKALSIRGIAHGLGQAQPGYIEIPAKNQAASSSQATAQQSDQITPAVTESAKQTGQAQINDIESTKKHIHKLATNSEPGSIWEKITPTQERWNEYSSFPKSFEIEVDGKKFWVNPNGSKHMMEMTSPSEMNRISFDTLRSPWDIPAKEFKMSHEQILNDFSSALQEATKNGIPYKQRITVNNWELEIGYARIPGGYPTIIHARPIGS